MKGWMTIAAALVSCGAGDPVPEPAPSPVPVAPPTGAAARPGARPRPGAMPIGGGGAAAARGGMNDLPYRVAFNNASPFAFTADGARHVVVAEGASLRYTRSVGGTESTSVLATDVKNHVVLATDGAASLVVAWCGMTGVFVRVSTDGGRTFGPPATLAAGGVAPSLAAWQTKDGRTEALIAWHDGVPGASNHVRAAVYDGAAWGLVETVDHAATEAVFASVAGGPDRQVVVWRQRGTDGSWSITERSRTAGRWGEPRTVAAGLDPSVCMVDADTWHVAYQNRMATYAVHTEDGGATWSSAASLGQGTFARVACDDDQVVVAWEWVTPTPGGPPVPGQQANHLVKTIGLATSADGAAFTVKKPFDRQGLIFGTVTLRGDAIELMYLDVTSGRLEFSTDPQG